MEGSNQNLGVSNANIGFSNENLRVFDENLEVFYENPGVSHNILGGLKILGVSNEILGGFNWNLGVYDEILGVFIEDPQKIVGSSLKFLGSATKIWGLNKELGFIMNIWGSPMKILGFCKAETEHYPLMLGFYKAETEHYPLSNTQFL